MFGITRRLLWIGAISCAAVVATSTQALSASAASSHSLALSPDGATLFVVNPDSGSVSSVDTLTDQKSAEVTVGDDPRILALSPDGRLHFVTNQRSGDVDDNGRIRIVPR
jgi:YVTN family beta-propeller protein